MDEDANDFYTANAKDFYTEPARNKTSSWPYVQ